MRNPTRYLSAQLVRLLVSDESNEPAGANSGKSAGLYARVSADEACAAIAALRDRLGAQGGLMLAQKLNVYRGNHLLMSIMSHCDTLQKAIEKLAKYHDIASNAVKLLLRRGANGLAVRWQADLPLDPVLEQVLIEAAVAACTLMIRDITAGKAQLEEVRFAYPEPEDTQPYRRFFECPVLFDQPATEILLRKDVLSLPVAASDPQLLNILEDYAGNYLTETDGETADQVSRHIREVLLRGQTATVQSAAEALCRSVRSLQLRLRSEGTSYRILLETVKQEIAVQALRRGDMPLYDIAFILGFSEQSAFNHAFKRWTGQSPRQYLNGSKNRDLL